MLMKKYDKPEIIAKHARSEGDTGSIEVQVALLTGRINYLTKHFNEHKKDKHSRLGMLKMVGKRSRLLRYLHTNNEGRYKNLLSELGLRK